MHIEQFISFDICRQIWKNAEKLAKPYPFQQLWYLELFTQHFAKLEDIFLLGIYEGDEVLSLGAFEKIDQKIVFLGTKDVSKTKNLVQDITDFADLLYTPAGREKVSLIWEEIAKFFKEKGYKEIELRYVREDSPTYKVHSNDNPTAQQEVSPFINLPENWELYLDGLEKKQRHELKRKINRLSQVAYSFERKAVTKEMFDNFIKLHKLSDFNKAKFMTDYMEAFFWDLVSSDKTIWETAFYTLSIEGKEVSSVLVFENSEQTLLYNSGFDPSFGYYSAGLLGKAFILKKAIEEKKKIYDFLRGNERYKYDLGAKDVPLFQIKLF